MSNQTRKLIELLRVGKSCNEICKILKLSNKQLYNNLTNIKNKGLLIFREYYDTGDITYQLVNEYSNIDYTTIIPSKNTDKIKVLVLSDLHFGNSNERLDLVYRAFNYCIKRGIHLIFCCGDLIDGTYSRGEQRITDPYEQVNYFLKNYPCDKNILTFGVGGDHDLSILTNFGQDFLQALYNYRHDCIVPSYNNALIKINNENIVLHHHIQKDVILDDSRINFIGHSHKYNVSYEKKDGVLNIKVPSISDINVQPYEVLPTVIETELEFSEKELKGVQLSQIYFGEKDYILNESYYDLTKDKIEKKLEKKVESIKREKKKS